MAPASDTADLTLTPPMSTPKMRLHWSPLSPFVRIVTLTAHECGLADRIETVRSRVYATAPNPDLLPDNPLAKIPTLILADGRRLQDSRVICEYLDRRRLTGGPPLHPADPAARLDALRRQALGVGLLDVLIFWRQEGEREPAHRSTELASAAWTKISATLGVLEDEAPGWAGRPFDIGDVAIGCAMGYRDYRFPSLAWRDAHPRLADWLDQFLARPSAVATAPINDKTPPPPFKGGPA